ncbi:Enoyl-[acyl-carrier-protein] reductase [NADH], chloroplastic [Linum perenne]
MAATLTTASVAISRTGPCKLFMSMSSLTSSLSQPLFQKPMSVVPLKCVRAVPVRAMSSKNDTLPGLPIDLRGKRAFIAGVADDNGYGWAIAKSLAAAGAEILLGTWVPALNIFESSLRRGKFDKSRVLPDGSLMEITKVYPMDAVFDGLEDVPEDIKTNKRYAGSSNWTVKELAESVKQDFGSIDILVHSLANGPEVVKPLLETSRNGYLAAISASSYSFISLLQNFLPIMNPGGATISLTYIASERIIPGYGGGMSSAKAALESDTRVLAFEAGRKHRIRVNTISAGPLRSRAAKAIGFIDMMIDYSTANAPLQKELSADEVGNAAAFLVSPLASAITGTVLSRKLRTTAIIFFSDSLLTLHFTCNAFFFITTESAMKASIKFRDEQKPPLFRGKIPLNILGFPFLSGIVAGDSKELSLNLSTFFDSGPSLKVAYRPNDSWNPFSFVVKTGTGNFGSPISSPMVMSAEFNLIGNWNGNPSFMLHFKPRLGDFSIKKSQTSLASRKEEIRSGRNGVVVNSSPDLNDGSLHAVELLENPPENGFGAKRFTALTPTTTTTSSFAAGLSGVEVTAETKLPIRSHAVMSFRWGLMVPATNKIGGSKSDLDWMINVKNVPLLMMNKIGIELVDKKPDSKSPPAAEIIDQKPDVAAVNRQLEILQRENGLLKKEMDDLRREIGGSKFLMQNPDSGFNKNREADRNRNRNRVENKKKSSSVEEDVSEQLKKALKGAGNGGS